MHICCFNYDFQALSGNIFVALCMTLLKASGFLGRQQQLLAEAQYSRKFKLKFIRILVTHPVIFEVMSDETISVTM